MSQDPRYPIGSFTYDGPHTFNQRADCINKLATLPGRMASTLENATDQVLGATYREGSWTVRQLVHHVADSNINLYTRFRLALTEDNPTIRTFEENPWAELVDAKTAPIAPSIVILTGLHTRLDFLLRSLNDAQFARRLTHPESGTITVDKLLAYISWHGEHHFGQIKNAIQNPAS